MYIFVQSQTAGLFLKYNLSRNSSVPCTAIFRMEIIVNPRTGLVDRVLLPHFPTDKHLFYYIAGSRPFILPQNLKFPFYIEVRNYSSNYSRQSKLTYGLHIIFCIVQKKTHRRQCKMSPCKKIDL
jgi:hypothetical protein